MKTWYQILTCVKNWYQIITDDWLLIFPDVFDKTVKILNGMKMQQLWEVLYQCEDYACMLFEIFFTKREILLQNM